MASKEHILSEIKRLAAADGKPPGRESFARATSIPAHAWRGKHWTSWGEALREAGFDPNHLTQAQPESALLERLAGLARRLGRIPTQSDLQMERNRDGSFPSHGTFARLGPKDGRCVKLRSFCIERGFEDVAQYCTARLESLRPPDTEAPDASSTSPRAGYVYLVRHGSRREFKIGMTRDPLRRQGEVAIELPGEMRPVHIIETDDPAGVEYYWHRRFADKRLRGEWFSLTADDERAFKRWRKIF